jgi:hypothetical protein
LHRIFSQSKRHVNASRGNSILPTDYAPTQGYAIPATEIVPSDFTCSVSSLGQSSLHYPPAEINLRRSHLAETHSWWERIQILHCCM